MGPNRLPVSGTFQYEHTSGNNNNIITQDPEEKEYSVTLNTDGTISSCKENEHESSYHYRNEP